MMQLAKRNLRSATVHFFLALCLVPGRLSAQSTQTASESPFSDRTEGDFIIKDFHFHDGEVLPELRLRHSGHTAPKFIWSNRQCCPPIA
jgi:hypothetical protein